MPPALPEECLEPLSQNSVDDSVRLVKMVREADRTGGGRDFDLTIHFSLKHDHALLRLFYGVILGAGARLLDGQLVQFPGRGAQQIAQHRNLGGDPCVQTGVYVWRKKRRVIGR